MDGWQKGRRETLSNELTFRNGTLRAGNHPCSNVCYSVHM